MKQFKLHHKLFAILISLFFVFQTMYEINDHTYTIGVDHFNYYRGCMAEFWKV